jgi:hypothetical protein
MFARAAEVKVEAPPEKCANAAAKRKTLLLATDVEIFDIDILTGRVVERVGWFVSAISSNVSAQPTSLVMLLGALARAALCSGRLT